MKIVTQLESTKNINKLKHNAIKAGGYKKNRLVIEIACSEHLQSFGIDLMPKQLK